MKIEGPALVSFGGEQFIATDITISLPSSTPTDTSEEISLTE